MDWTELGKKIVSIGAPLLGGALGGPGGAAIGGLVARAVGGQADDPADIYAKIQADPTAVVKLRDLELKHEERLEELSVQRAHFESEQQISIIREINQTMQAEAGSEKWPQYSWRPFNGFAFPLAVLAIYFVLPLAKLPVPEVPQWVWAGWLSILGVAAYHRGKEKRLQAGDPATGLIPGVINAIKGGT